MIDRSSTWSAACRFGSGAIPLLTSNGDVSGKSVARITRSPFPVSTIRKVAASGRPWSLTIGYASTGAPAGVLQMTCAVHAGVVFVDVSWSFSPLWPSTVIGCGAVA